MEGEVREMKLEVQSIDERGSHKARRCISIRVEFLQAVKRYRFLAALMDEQAIILNLVNGLGPEAKCALINKVKRAPFHILYI